jgi:hypothetical protein
MSKRAGRKSQSQNDFLQPSAPVSVSATDVGTSRAFNNGAATVSFSLPGGSPAATSFTVTSSPGSFTATGSSSPLTVQGLQSGVSYTFTVTATNAQGTSAASSASTAITATTVPATPNPPTVSAQVDYDNVSWTAPATGGKSITVYTWTSTDAKTGTTAATSVNVTQEANTSQAYDVRAENANGAGLYSSYSNTVTTLPPYFPPFFPPTFGPYFPPSFGPYFPPYFGGFGAYT